MHFVDACNKGLDIYCGKSLSYDVKEYCNGHIVDWGFHHIDIIRHIMGFQMPNSIVANGGLEVLKDKITTPDTLNVVMNFNDCPVIWDYRILENW